MHFKSQSAAKKLYFLLTSNVYENFILAISYLYLFLSIIEPGNHSERPYEVSDSSFKAILVIEILCQITFVIDILIQMYIRFILIKQNG